MRRRGLERPSFARLDSRGRLSLHLDGDEDEHRECGTREIGWSRTQQGSGRSSGDAVYGGGSEPGIGGGEAIWGQREVRLDCGCGAAAVAGGGGGAGGGKQP